MKKLPAVKLSALPAEERAKIVDVWLDAYEKNARVADLAKQAGISETTVYKHFLLERPEVWRAVSAARSLKRLEDAKKKLDDATDHLELGRAERQIKAAQWELERLWQRVYGQKPEPQVTDKVSININFGNPEKSIVIENAPLENGVEGGRED